jgi:hypothetical protein
LTLDTFVSNNIKLFFIGLKIKLRALCMLGKHTVTELHPALNSWFSYEAEEFHLGNFQTRIRLSDVSAKHLVCVVWLILMVCFTGPVVLTNLADVCCQLADFVAICSFYKHL